MIVLAMEELEPGMVLAEAVRNHQDQLLLDAGRKVTDKTIRVFKSWGIRRVAVQTGPGGDSDPSVLSGSVPPGALNEALKARFAGVLHDPIMVAVMQAVGRQIATRPSRKKSRNGRS